MYKMRQVLSFFFLVFSFPLYAQEPQLLWLKEYGGNRSDQVQTNVTKVTDGGFIVCIATTSDSGIGNIDSFCGISGRSSIFLKYSADGSNLEWSKCSVNGSYIYPQNDGGFIFGGMTSSVPSGWAFKIVKEDASGTITWSKTYGGQAASAILRSMTATEDGGYIMVGETNYTDSDFTTHHGGFMEADIAVIKVDSNGNKVWSRVIGGSGEDQASAIVLAPNGGCYVVGSTYSNDYDCTGNHGSKDAYIFHLDSNGNIIWHKDLGGTRDDFGAYACSNGKGGIIIAAHTGSEDGDVMHHIHSGTWNFWAVEMDSNNNVLWSNCYGGGGEEYPYSICKATDGSIWLAGVSHFMGGEVDTEYGKNDAWFVHTDSTGNFVGANVVGSSLWDRGTMIYPLSTGNVIAGGFYDIGGGSFSSTWYGENDAFLAVFAPTTNGIRELQVANAGMNIYPNPANEQITIETRNSNNQLTIIDVIGRVIYRTNFFDKIQIPVKEWGKGMYFVQLIGEDGSRGVGKLVVQ
jgi:Secretion system C-terminal sorting domain